MRTRTLIASLVTAVALTGCSASADESSSPNAETSPSASASASSSPDAPETSSTATATPDVSVAEIPTESAKPARARGWTGPKGGFTFTSEVTDKKAAEAAGNAALAFLRKWTLREDLMRADLRAAHTALSGVTAELDPNAAAAWQQNLKAAAGLKDAKAWGALQALVRVAATGPEWEIPANVPLVSNRTFVDDVFVTTDDYTGGYRVGIDYSGDLTKLADPAKPKVGYLRTTQDTSLSLVMTRGGAGWQIFSWQGTYKAGDPVFLD